MTARGPVIVAGAGPAGLAAARLLSANGIDTVVCEQGDRVGDLARTEPCRGCRFGRRLYLTFFKTYTEKVRGMPCSEIRADWAAQRIKGVTFRTAVADALRGGSPAASLARGFHYPRLGPGQMWERFAELVAEAGGTVRLGTAVTRLHHDGRAILAVDVDDGRPETVPAWSVISSLPLRTLLERLDPLPPPEVLEVGRTLRYRDFILVGLILDAPHAFPDTWLYVHAPEVLVGRIQKFRNWSAAMVPDARRTSLGMEYFCSEGDQVWSRSGAELLDLAAREPGILGLTPRARRGRVRDPPAKSVPGVRRRVPVEPHDDSDLSRAVREPPDGRPQRHAPVQQPGPLDADRAAGGPQPARRATRPPGCQRRAVVHRGPAGRFVRGAVCAGVG